MKNQRFPTVMGIYGLQRVLSALRATRSERAWPVGTTWLVDAHNLMFRGLPAFDMLEQLALHGYPIILVFDGSLGNCTKLQRKVNRTVDRMQMRIERQRETGEYSDPAGQMSTVLSYTMARTWARRMRVKAAVQGIPILVVCGEDNKQTSADAYITNWVYTHPDVDCVILSRDSDLLFTAQVRRGVVTPVPLIDPTELRMRDGRTLAIACTWRDLLQPSSPRMTCARLCASWMVGQVGNADDVLHMLNNSDAIQLRPLKWRHISDVIADMVRYLPDGMYAQHLLPLLSASQRALVLQPRPETWFQDMMVHPDVQRRVCQIRSPSFVRILDTQGNVVPDILEFVRRCAAMDLARVGIERLPEVQGVFILIDGQWIGQVGLSDAFMARVHALLRVVGVGEYEHVVSGAAEREMRERPMTEQEEVIWAQYSAPVDKVHRIHDMMRLLWLLSPTDDDDEALRIRSTHLLDEMHTLSPIDDPDRLHRYWPRERMTCIANTLPDTMSWEERIEMVYLACRSAKINPATWFWGTFKIEL